MSKGLGYTFTGHTAGQVATAATGITFTTPPSPTPNTELEDHIDTLVALTRGMEQLLALCTQQGDRLLGAEEEAEAKAPEVTNLASNGSPPVLVRIRHWTTQLSAALQALNHQRERLDRL